MAKPFLHHEGDLPSLRVRNLLVEGKEEAAYLPPIHPKGGEVYLFSTKDKASKATPIRFIVSPFPPAHTRITASLFHYPCIIHINLYCNTETS